MPKPAALHACVVLALSVQGGVSAQPSPAPAASPPTSAKSQGSYVFPNVEARLHEQYPEYIGFEVYGGTLYLAVNSSDPAVRLRILRAVQAAHAPFSPVLRAQQVRFLQGSAEEHLAAANDALRNVRGQTLSQPRPRIERLVVGLQHPYQRDEAEALFCAAGVRLDAVVIITSPAVRPLPTGPALTAPLEAKLQVPATVRQGEKLPITLRVRNTCQNVVEFEHGACDFHVEIRRVTTGEGVLPIPTMETCITIGYTATFQPGEEKELASRQWKVETMDWKTLAPGEYELRASFGPVLGVVRNQPLPYILPAPVRFKVLGSSR